MPPAYDIQILEDRHFFKILRESSI